MQDPAPPIALHHDNRFAAVAEARRTSVGMRLVLAAVLGVFCLIFTRDLPLSLTWFVLVVATQVLDRIAIGAFLAAPAARRRRESLVLTATTTLAALVWSMGFLLLWRMGGDLGKVVATLSCAGSMLHVAVVCYHSPRLFWLMIAPYALMLAGPMILMSTALGDVPLVAGLGLMAAGVGFIGNFFASYRQLRGMTERVEASRAEAEARRQEADAANAAKSDFLATMSHELRTPLNAVIGYAEILEEELSRESRDQSVRDAERIRVAGRHLLTLINAVLDLSKIEAGRLDVHPTDVDVAQLVAEVCMTVAPAARTNRNRLHVRCARDEAGVTDGVLLRQCLLNLLSNASKFTRDGRVDLQVLRQGDTLTFIVTDTGIGMTEAQMANLFQPFVQADASVTRKFGGTGLGLAITRRLAGMMGGDVSVSSRIGEGSTFTLTIHAPRPALARAA